MACRIFGSLSLYCECHENGVIWLMFKYTALNSDCCSPPPPFSSSFLYLNYLPLHSPNVFILCKKSVCHVLEIWDFLPSKYYHRADKDCEMACVGSGIAQLSSKIPEHGRESVLKQTKWLLFVSSSRAQLKEMFLQKLLKKKVFGGMWQQAPLTF